MDVRVRCCGIGPRCFAADGSHIGETAVRNYLESKEYALSIEGKLTMGYLTHRGRSLDVLPSSVGNPGIKKVVGRDDAGLIVGENLPTFTHYVKEFYIEDVPGEGPWLCALVHIFDENQGFDEISIQNIKRLKALIRSGVRLTCSLVVLAFWSSEGGIDECKSIKAIKSLDWTVNPSFGPLARITEVIDDENKDALTKEFSEIENDRLFISTQPSKEGEIRVKVFSDLTSLGYGDMPKTSKIDNKYTFLKAKEFSSVCSVEEVQETVKQKEYSVATLKERVRYAKFSVRQQFRRLFIDYKQLVKSYGGGDKMDPEIRKICESLFTSDVLNLIKKITPEILAGKQINTLIGASSLGKSIRQAAQQLQIPFRFAMQEIVKTGKISPMRYKKIQEAYTEFTKAMLDEVFGPNPIPEGLAEEVEKEEGGTVNEK